LALGIFLYDEVIYLDVVGSAFGLFHQFFVVRSRSFRPKRQPVLNRLFIDTKIERTLPKGFAAKTLDPFRIVFSSEFPISDDIFLSSIGKI
jgi:hypothetical protein